MLVQLIYISTIVGVTIDQIENFIDGARIRNLNIYPICIGWQIDLKSLYLDFNGWLQHFKKRQTL